MRAGKLDRRITIQRQLTEQNSHGEEIVTWQDVGTVFAQKIDNRGDERYASHQFIGDADTRFRVRWSHRSLQTTTKHRIWFDGRAFDITAVREIGRREGVEIDCVARGAERLVPPRLDFSDPDNSQFIPGF